MSAYKKKSSLLFKRDGTCHAERLPKELANNNKLIDEKTLDEHIIFIYLYSDLIKYYGNQNIQAHHNAWRTFLENDDTIIFSLIIHTEIAQLKSLINDDLLLLQQEKEMRSENKYTNHLLRILEELLVLINYWHKNLSASNSLKLELQNLITYKLSDRVTLLYDLLKQWNNPSSLENFSHFCSFIEHISKKYTHWKLSVHGTAENFTHTQNLVSLLQELFDVLMSALLNIQQLAKEGYRATLSSQQHPPQTALLIAFLRLLQYASFHINQIPQRHLDFYYNEVLKFRKKPVTPDKVIVHFQLQEAIKHYLLPKGTKLLAGKDQEGRDILFETTRSIVLNQGVIKTIHKVHQVKKEPSNHQCLPVGDIDTATYSAAELNKQQPSAQPPQQPTRNLLGLVIASPILYLKEGHREIKLKFFFSQKSFEAFIARARQNENEDITEVQDRIVLLFQQGINIHLTSEESWISLPPNHTTIAVSKKGEHFLEATLVLPPEVLPIVNFNPEVHGDPYPIVTPAIKISLNDTINLGLIYLFKDLILEKLSFHVAVKDYRALILHNDLGLVENTYLFQPFGPFPQLHANFYLGSDEIFFKNLTSFKINIDWENLPRMDGGWERYYQGYPQKVTPEDFKVNVSYLNHRQWHPFDAKDRQQVTIFSYSNIGKYGPKNLQNKHVIDDIDLAKLNLTKTVYKLDPPLLTPKTLTGFLKLKLCGPDMAFGHSIYPSLMSSAFIQNANKKKQVNIPALNEPYTPVIKSLSIDYSAKEDMVFSSNTNEAEKNQALLKLSLFGYRKIAPNQADSVTFLSDSDNIGCFFCFGFEHLEASFLSVHLQIDENSIDPDKDFHRPVWQYLADNCWIDFRDDEIISDGTDGLTKSGIIVLSIPQEANTEHTLLSAGLVWLRAVFSEDIEALPGILGIYTQATTASRVIDQDQTMELPYPILPRAIQGIMGNPAEIKEVVQPFSPFGGRPPESQHQFYTRVSERLRHKNRAISAWDYERIILEKFPEIFRVKCVNHSSKDQSLALYPGQVMIVVINKLQNNRKKNEFTPKVSKQLLREIQRYLESVASPFVKFEVTGPIYEEVKVNVEVKFSKDCEKGIYLNKLQRDLRNFFSPWLFNKAEDVKLGGMIPSSKVIDFITKKEYVEGIGNFSILKYTGKGSTLTITKITDYDNYLKATYPWSVMVSADKHKIVAIDETLLQTSLRRGGVDDMGIGEDFIIGPWQEGKIKAEEANFKQEEEVVQESLEEYYLVTKKHM